jgi:hypothetical protein
LTIATPRSQRWGPKTSLAGAPFARQFSLSFLRVIASNPKALEEALA